MTTTTPLDVGEAGPPVPPTGLRDMVLAGLQHADVEPIATIRGCVLLTLQQYFLARGFKQLLPVLISPITDPLNHATYPAEIHYGDQTLKVSASMIFHKQLAVTARGHEKVFAIAPNIRLEKEGVKGSDNHLLEFSQCDFEVRGEDMGTSMKRVERLLRHVISAVKHRCSAELRELGREMPYYTADFPVYDADLLRREYGSRFEDIMSGIESTPFFITNHRREFYDKEHPPGSGRFNNFDLVYPDGFGEALSGAEREFDYARIVRRMQETGVATGVFSNYLAVAREGVLLPSAGAGLGVERLLKFICGKRHIRDVTLFDRTVGTSLVF